MDIRSALKSNLAKISTNDLKDTIESGIASKEETILPGLGVLFEMYYLSLDNTAKNQWLQDISKLLN